MTERIAYDELALFHENAEEYGIPWPGPPVVARTAVEVDRPSGRAVSALLWGTESPEIVFVHGGAQNAHTWDTVALALGRPALAVDLPGHGHSGWRDDLAVLTHDERRRHRRRDRAPRSERSGRCRDVARRAHFDRARGPSP